MDSRHLISDGKYVVFKIEDFYAFCGELWRNSPNPQSVIVDELAMNFVVSDATVLRDQDLLTAGALNTYADAALLLGELLEDLGQISMAKRMWQRAEFFRSRGLRAQLATNRRIPD